MENKVKPNGKASVSANGKTVEIARVASGDWVCKVDSSIPAKYHPVGCE